jgi:hypothetical protein
MKQIIVIPEFHSLIDVITNSSTELFIADTDKSIDAIKELLAGLSQYADCDSDCGVGKIYVITEDNIKEFIDSTHYYLVMCDDMIDSSDFCDDYFRKKGWDVSGYRIPRCLSKDDNERETYAEHMREAFDAYDIYKENFLNDHMEEYKRKLLGKTIIEGSDDNSIPYEIFDILNKKLNAYHIHLG